MANPVTQAPTLDTMVRQANGSIRFTWTNNVPSGAQTYTTIDVQFRVAGAGTFTSVNNFQYPSISNQHFTQYVKPGGGAFLPGVGYEMRLRAHGPAGWSAPSGTRSVPAMVTPTPTLSSVTRGSAAGATAVIVQNSNPPATVDAVYLYTRAVGTSTWTQRNRTTSPSQTSINVPLPDGGTAYEVVARSSGPAGLSADSAVRTVAAWWQTPSNPSIIGATRDPSTGEATLTWEADSTAQAPILSIEIWAAVGPTGQFFRVTTLPGTRRTWTGSADPTRAYRFRVILKSHAGDGAATTSALNPTILVPNPPSGLTATYTGTDQIAVTWTRNPTTERPYTLVQRVGRRPAGDDAAAWTWTNAASTATSTTITAPANGRYDITVDAGNAAGRSEIATPVGPVTTTPARPASLSASWVGTDIVVTIPAYATVGDRLVLEFSTDNALWFPAASVPVEARSWLHDSPTPALPHYYRARVESDAAGTPDSSVVASAVVPALTKPAPPTVLPLTTLDATAPIPVAVIHNSLDGTGQTAGEIRHRVGTGAHTVITLGASSTGTIPAGAYTNGQALGLSARTQGAGGVWSDWSPERVETLRARPTGALTGPALVLAGQQATATWTAAAQSSALVELLDAAGGVLEAHEVGAAARSQAFAHVLEDQADYSIRLTIRDAYQASLPILRAFEVELDRPATPTATASFDPTLATVTAAVATDGDRVDLQRLDRDGQWRTYDTATPTAGVASLTDPLPPLTTATYRIRAHSTAGGWTDSAPIVVDATSCDVHINYGPTHSLLARAGWNPTIQVSTGRAKTLRRYVGDRDPSPVWGGQLPYVITAGFLLDPRDGESDLHDWERIAEQTGTVVWRDPAGRIAVGVIDDFTADDSNDVEQFISFTFTRTGDAA